MTEYGFNHIIPAKILKNFRIEGTDKTIFCLDKKRKKVYPESAKGKNPLFNLEDFYSKKTLRQLSQENRHIKLNPLFTLLDEPLEINLKKCFEDRIGNITDEIISNPKKELKEEEINFIKEYLYIQRVRTKKYKEDVEYLSPNIKEVLPSKDIFKKVVSEYMMHSHLKSMNSELRKKAMQEAIKIRRKMQKYQENPDLHSLDIISKEKMDSYYRIMRLDTKNVSFLINQTGLPFIMPDSAVVEKHSNFPVEKLEISKHISQ